MIRVGKPLLIQLVAWTNSPTQSFEVTKCYDLSTDDVRDAMKDLLVISKKLHSLVVKGKNTAIPNKKLFTAGVSNKVFDVSSSEAKDIVKTVRYAWRQGHCLDPKKLSYFVPERILAEGDITVDELKNL